MSCQVGAGGREPKTAGEKAFETTDLQMWVAINRMVPEPTPNLFKGGSKGSDAEEQVAAGPEVLGLTIIEKTCRRLAIRCLTLVVSTKIKCAGIMITALFETLAKAVF